MKPLRHPDACPAAIEHNLGPVSYVDWQEWAERMAETHDQAQCPSCDLWVIWTPKVES